MYTHKQFNRLLDENEYNALPEFAKNNYEFYGVIINTEGGIKPIDMREMDNNNPGNNNTATNSIAGQNNTEIGRAHV